MGSRRNQLRFANIESKLITNSKINDSQNILLIDFYIDPFRNNSSRVGAIEDWVALKITVFRACRRAVKRLLNPVETHTGWARPRECDAAILKIASDCGF